MPSVVDGDVTTTAEEHDERSRDHGSDVTKKHPCRLHLHSKGHPLLNLAGAGGEPVKVHRRLVHHDHLPVFTDHPSIVLGEGVQAGQVRVLPGQNHPRHQLYVPAVFVLVEPVRGPSLTRRRAPKEGSAEAPPEVVSRAVHAPEHPRIQTHGLGGPRAVPLEDVPGRVHRAVHLGHAHGIQENALLRGTGDDREDRVEASEEHGEDEHLAGGNVGGEGREVATEVSERPQGFLVVVRCAAVGVRPHSVGGIGRDTRATTANAAAATTTAAAVF
mmetsp:Transcript_15517/g.20848  ORF Transcript_15517/g.20848 Transcript_15517/m.20848 type:complete len:273 (+) Transcript_15517:267-1085(+)